MYCYDYPHPAVTVDCVIVRRAREQPEVLLIQRKHAPFAGQWAFPGGFLDVDTDSSLEAAAHRELQEETSLTGIELTQLGAWGDIDRDPRERVITVAFLGLLSDATVPVRAADDARDARWFPLDDPPPLAFDHAHILAAARRRLFDGLPPLL
ncbi:MAG: NUDIX hydrolase [Candidatus Dadabacteria bacterium]|nr:MAG: NUDIX hydrolase [Candidatus Dadabacteria bacterium]